MTPKFKQGDLVSEVPGSPNEKEYEYPAGMILSYHCDHPYHLDREYSLVGYTYWYLVLEGEETVEWDAEYVDNYMVKIA